MLPCRSMGLFSLRLFISGTSIFLQLPQCGPPAPRPPPPSNAFITLLLSQFFSSLLTEKLAQRIAWHAKQPFSVFLSFLHPPHPPLSVPCFSSRFSRTFSSAVAVVVDVVVVAPGYVSWPRAHPEMDRWARVRGRGSRLLQWCGLLNRTGILSGMSQNQL